MKLGAMIAAGIAGSAAFAALDKFVLNVAPEYGIGGAILSFVLFAGLAAWLSRNPAARPGTRIGSNLRGKNVTQTIDGVTVTGGEADIGADLSASNDLQSDLKNINKNP